ncbi:hypothetical protein [Shimia marina]|uniref:Uncharacterized protein n=1 Tax=Shimia marina TaxID=321267 RepID=A0A0P1FFR9_9RHOB|nr:hypothetical protein [Shimia marina]CUH54410.1 hypothetical protein SHM7688_03881 [Shimia marina]SFE03023.1 hypothetical protein SAMN04488037_104289 [Shimia marina]
MRHLLPALIAAILMALFIALDTGRSLGAHPWWSQKTLLIGALIGLFLATLAGLKLRPMPLTVATMLGTILAFATAKYGQTQFAASYAEDQLAGQLWYLGWMATGALTAAWLTSVVQWLLNRE